MEPTFAHINPNGVTESWQVMSMFRGFFGAVSFGGACALLSLSIPSRRLGVVPGPSKGDSGFNG